MPHYIYITHARIHIYAYMHQGSQGFRLWRLGLGFSLGFGVINHTQRVLGLGFKPKLNSKHKRHKPPR
jgi:hypothetical protein